MAINGQGIYEWEGTETFPEWRDELTDSITDTVADIYSDIAGIAVPADSGWVTITTFTAGWTAAAAPNAPMIRKIGDRVDIKGWVNAAVGAATIGPVLTVPVGYRPAANVLTGAFLSSLTGGQRLRGMGFIATTGVYSLSSSFTEGTLTNLHVVPLVGSWYVS